MTFMINCQQLKKKLKKIRPNSMCSFKSQHKNSIKFGESQKPNLINMQIMLIHLIFC